MKNLYISPLILDGNGIITVRASQLTKIGLPESLADAWSDFVSDNGEMMPDNFDPLHPETWPDGASEVFDFENPDTWFPFVEWWMEQNYE